MRHKKYSYEDAILYGSTADTGNIEISLCFRQTVRQKKETAVTTDTEKVEIGCAAEKERERTMTQKKDNETRRTQKWKTEKMPCIQIWQKRQQRRQKKQKRQKKRER